MYHLSMNGHGNKRFNEKEAVGYIKSEAKKRNCKIKIFTKDRDKDELFEYSDGEFSEENMEIKCFKNGNDKNKYWLAVLAHEYHHLLQSEKPDKAWIEFVDNTSDYIYELEEIFDQSSKPRISKNQRIKIAKSTIKLELDCEIKTLNFLKNVDANINIDYYIGCANIILYKYIFWAKTGRWVTLKKSDEDFEKLIEDLIKTNNLNVFKKLNTYLYMNIPKNILTLFEKNKK